MTHEYASPRGRLRRGIDYGFASMLLALWGAGTLASLRLPQLHLSASVWVGGGLWLLLVWATLAPEGSRWRGWRGTLQFAACWTLFPLFKAIRQHFYPQSADAALLALDRRLWGGASLPERVMALERPWLSEIVSTGYFCFYFLVLLPALYYSVRRTTPQARAFFHGLSAMYLVGFAGYFCVPAAGPYLAFPQQFPYPVEGGAMTAFLTGIVADGITGMDVFPSLHAGIGSFVVGFLWRAGHRRLALLLTPVLAVLVLATVYLRYHYGIDVLCGLALAATVLACIPALPKEFTPP